LNKFLNTILNMHVQNLYKNRCVPDDVRTSGGTHFALTSFSYIMTIDNNHVVAATYLSAI
jgi:hypothetical protein